MKKVLLILFVLAILLLAFPQGVLAATFPSNDVVINAEFGTATSFNAQKSTTAFPDTWGLKPGENNQVDEGINFFLTTQSNGWSVTAESANNGFMTGGLQNLQSPFLVYSTTAGNYVAPTGGVQIKGGDALNTNQDWNANIRQPVALNDIGADLWTITIVFTCSAGF